MKILISDEQLSKIVKEQLQKLSNVNAPSDYLGKGGEFERSQSSKKTPVNWIVYKCIPQNLQVVPNYVFNKQNKLMSDLKVDKKTLTLYTKIALGIMGRETSFNQYTEFNDDAIQFFYEWGLGFIPKTVEKGYETVTNKKRSFSLGPAQFMKDTWNKFGLDKKIGTYEKSLSVLSHALAVIHTTNDLYKKAYNVTAGTGPSVNPIAMRQGKIKSINGTGNSSLDLAIVSHNMSGMINKWCETSDPNFAGPCNQKIYQPYKTTKPEIKVNVYQNKPILNYFPNKGHDKLTSIGYLEKVVTYVRKFDCFNL